MPDTRDYAVTYYGRHNVRFQKQVVHAVNFVDALSQVAPPPGSVRVWVGIIPPSKPQPEVFYPRDAAILGADPSM